MTRLAKGLTMREATLSPRHELWHAAGRIARDGRLRQVARWGLLCSAPVLLLGSATWQLIWGAAGAGGAARPLAARPLAYLLAPLDQAWRCGCDAALVGYLLWQWMLLTLLWGYFGGILYRLAAVRLTQGRVPGKPAGAGEARAATSLFVRAHWRGFAGARLALLLGTTLPLLLASLLATVGRLDGWIGGVLLALVVLVVVLLAALSVVVGSACLMGGFLTGPTIACEDSNSFDALSRAVGYAAAGLPRLCLMRLQFFAGTLIGSAWRLLLTGAVVGLTLAVLRLGAGADAMARIEAVLGARGVPADAARLGLTAGDYLAAIALGLALFVLLLRWAADAVARVHCGQTAAYLVLRREIDHVVTDELCTRPAAPTFRTAAEAGFHERDRIQ